MIKSWKNERTRKVFSAGISRGFRGMNRERAENRLAALNAAASLADLRTLQGAALHKLRGSRRGQWAMTVNGPWRVCFSFRMGDAYDVEITDDHKG